MYILRTLLYRPTILTTENMKKLIKWLSLIQSKVINQRAIALIKVGYTQPSIANYGTSKTDKLSI